MYIRISPQVMVLYVIHSCIVDHHLLISKALEYVHVVLIAMQIIVSFIFV